MELKEKILEKAHDYCFENYSGLQNNLDHIKEQGFLDGVEWLYDQQTTSQQQTIERLREMLKKSMEIYLLKVDGKGEPQTSIGEIIDFWDEVKQFLNTIEPIDQ